MRTRRQTLTTTLPAATVDELRAISDELRQPIGAILEDAFIVWNKRRKQALLAESYRHSRALRCRHH